MSGKKRNRQWFCVWVVGEENPCWLVSACSKESVERMFSLSVLKYKIIPCKVWVFLKIMSGRIIDLPAGSSFAPNLWQVENEGIKYKVMILN